MSIASLGTGLDARNGRIDEVVSDISVELNEAPLDEEEDAIVERQAPRSTSSSLPDRDADVLTGAGGEESSARGGDESAVAWEDVSSVLEFSTSTRLSSRADEAVVAALAEAVATGGVGNRTAESSWTTAGDVSSSIGGGSEESDGDNQTPSSER
jgi:hypothetical protein